MEQIRKSDAIHAVLHNTGDAAVAAIEEIKAENVMNNHEVACILADLFGDECACNFNGIDEWLPLHCDFAEKECPDVVGVTCWEQYLKYREKRKEQTNETD